MKRTTILTISLCILAIFALYTIHTIADQHSTKTEQITDYENNWHHWRGPHTNGTAINANPPLTWSESENIRWKVAIPGLGHATPIVWKDKIYIQTAILGERPKVEEDEKTEETETVDDNPFAGFLQDNRGNRNDNRNERPYKFSLIALKRSNGDQLWEKLSGRKYPMKVSTGMQVTHPTLP